MVYSASSSANSSSSDAGPVNGEVSSPKKAAYISRARSRSRSSTSTATPGETAENTGENASFAPACTTARTSFWRKISFTISASAGEDKVCRTTNRAPLLSCSAVSGVRRSTSSAPSSGQRVMPGLYSDSQVGQNMQSVSSLKFQVSSYGSSFHLKVSARLMTLRLVNLRLETC